MQIKCKCKKCEYKPNLKIIRMSSKWNGVQECNYYKVKDFAEFLSHNYKYDGNYAGNIENANLSIKNKLQMYNLIK